jgi:peptidoglycan-N-acetylglucosamine deacetylase
MVSSTALITTLKKLHHYMNPENQNKYSVILTVDVEDWFQVENLKKYIPFSTWPERQLRVERNTHRLLDLFDSIKTRGPRSEIGNHKSGNIIKNLKSIDDNLQLTTNNEQTKSVRATFFVLGWVAERLPHLVREIHSRGHEVASHGYNHALCYDCGRDELREDLLKSKKMLEDIISTPVNGYRAPSFSITDKTLKIIEECGYLYDSSYNSFGMHGRYGRLDVREYQRSGISLKLSDTFFELPVSNLQFSIFNLKSSIFNPVLPWGGGGYFRLIPFPIFKRGVDYILNKEKCYLFYMHPWEIDATQPRVDMASNLNKFKHYTNLTEMQSKLKRMIDHNLTCNFIRCDTYLNLTGVY